MFSGNVKIGQRVHQMYNMIIWPISQSFGITELDFYFEIIEQEEIIPQCWTANTSSGSTDLHSCVLSEYGSQRMKTQLSKN